MVFNIFWMVQQAKMTKQINNKGQNTSISIILKYVHIVPKTKAKVARYQIYISPSVRTSGLSLSWLRLKVDWVALWACQFICSAKQMSSSWSSSAYWSVETPRGVKQLMSSCSRQKPMRQVAISQEADRTMWTQEATRRQVAVHRSLRKPMS